MNLNIKELRDRFGKSQQKVADETGISRNKIAKWETTSHNPKTEDYIKLKAYFESLDTEINNVIIDNEEDYQKAKASGLKLLPEVDFKFSAGTVEIFNQSEFIKRYWYLPECKDCDGVAQVAGTSMLPTYPPGCWVALKRIGYSKETMNQIPFGQVFGIVVEDPVTGLYNGHIKILRKYKDQEQCKTAWIARSLNEKDFDDFDINIEYVRGLWIVKQHIVSDLIL